MKKTNLAITAGIFFLTLFVFQNCDGLHTGLTDVQSVLNLSTKADLDWSVTSLIPQTSVSTKLERWMDSTNAGIALYPPYRPGTTSLNMDVAPTLQMVGGRPWLAFPVGSSMAPAVADLSETTSDSYTALIVVRDINLLPDPTNAYTILRLFDITPTNGDQSAELTVDIYKDTTGIQLLGWYYFDNNNYKLIYYHIPDVTVATGVLAVGARFDKTGQNLQIFVNGKMGTGVPTVVGSPTQLPFAGRQVSIHSQNIHFSEFKVGEFALWRSALSDSQLQDYTRASYEIWSGTGAGNVGGDTGSGPGTGSGAFNTVASILSANSCFNCHSSISTRSGFLAMTRVGSTTPWVTSGNSSGSLVIQALRHQSGAQPMPQGGGSVPSSDIDKIAQWIDAGAP